MIHLRMEVALRIPISTHDVACARPQVLYQGFRNVNALLMAGQADYPTLLLVQIVFAKLATTALSKSAGLVGGFYAPSIFIGAALGYMLDKYV